MTFISLSLFYCRLPKLTSLNPHPCPALTQTSTKATIYSMRALNQQIKVINNCNLNIDQKKRDNHCRYTHRNTGLTSEVAHEAGLRSDDPLSSRLTEDGNVVSWLLTQ